MASSLKDNAPIIAAILLMVGIHLILAKGAIDINSPTYDEPVHLTAGYAYLKTADFRYNGGHHPPLAEMWAAVPLVSMKPILPVQSAYWLAQRWKAIDQYRFADLFLYRNRIPFDTLMAAGRWMQAGASVILGLLVMTVAWKIGGKVMALWSGLFWCFSPNILAHGTIVSTDFLFVLGFFGFFAALSISSLKGKYCWAGLFLGIALAAKFSSVAMMPIALLTLGILWFRDKSIFSNNNFPIMWIKNGAIMVVICILVVMAAYRGSEGPQYFSGLSQFLSRAQSGRSSYFWGMHGTEGWFLYFPTLTFLKTPVPLLIAVALALVAYSKKRGRLPVFLVYPPIMFFILSCFSQVQIGHRHVLAIYPFLFIWGAFGISALLRNKGVLISAAMGGWLMLGSLWAYPYYLPYFNEFIGGAKNGYKYFSDSNVDWGQGLRTLSRYLPPEEKEKGIYLSYFGVADPRAEGINYINVLSDQLVPHEYTQEAKLLNPSFFAISATNYQHTYFADKNLFQWLRDYQPQAVVAHSILLFDFRNHPEALEKCRQLAGLI